MFLLTALDGVLRLAGLAVCAGAAVVVRRLMKAKKACCDTACAAATLPADAFAGQVVWITGASSGIGEELAKQLAKQGAKLILSSRREDVLQELAERLRPQLEASKGEAKVLPLDLQDLESLPGKAKQALQMYDGTIDVLVNNGGRSQRSVVRKTKGLKVEQDLVIVNFLSYVALAKECLPAMIEQKRGRIINISSFAGKIGTPLRAMYCGVKHAIMGWFDALRAEEAAFNSGIRVTNVCPGSVQTDVSKNAATGTGESYGTTDPNIASGLEVEFVCDRILAAAHCDLNEVWIGKWQELRAVYMSQYFPVAFKDMIGGAAKTIIEGTMGKEYFTSAAAAMGGA